MNNNITENFVTYKVAKLLKEKGFNIKTVQSYCSSVNSNLAISIFPRINQHKPNVKEEWYAPTTALAIAWVRENFGIHIYIFPSNKGYVFSNSMSWQKSQWNPFEKYEDAENAALIYTLTNLK